MRIMLGCKRDKLMEGGAKRDSVPNDRAFIYLRGSTILEGTTDDTDRCL